MRIVFLDGPFGPEGPHHIPPPGLWVTDAGDFVELIVPERIACVPLVIGDEIAAAPLQVRYERVGGDARFGLYRCCTPWVPRRPMSGAEFNSLYAHTHHHRPPADFYARAQELDPWPGEDYQGSSAMGRLSRRHPDEQRLPGMSLPRQPNWPDQATFVEHYAISGDQFRRAIEQEQLHDTWLSPDAMEVSFTNMSTQAEAELAEWDRILHGD